MEENIRKIIRIKKYFYVNRRETIRTVGLTIVLTATIPTFVEAHLIAVLIFTIGMFICFCSLPR